MHLVCSTLLVALKARLCETGNFDPKPLMKAEAARELKRAVCEGRRKSRTGAVNIARREASWTNALLAREVALCARHVDSVRDAMVNVYKLKESSA